MTDRIEHVEVSAYTIPTDAPQSDGTLTWDSTTLVLVELRSAGHTGIGYSYAGAAAAAVVADELAPVVCGRDADTPAATWAAMHHATRNLGRPGLAAEAVSAVDIAAWDLHARRHQLPLCLAVGAVREAVPIYGSGGFTSYDASRLTAQLAGWVDAGIERVKMKVGRDPTADPHRVGAARDAVGDTAQLFVDANGGYRRKQALALADAFADCGVTWFEEPVSSDDLAGLALLRDRAPAGMDITAGEYGYDLPYFQRMLDAGAVDCLQADVTRCGGISGLLRVAALCDARGLDLSLHCAPQASLHAATAIWHLRHLEYFHDHVRVERLAFDGTRQPEPGGVLRPDRHRPGHGLAVRHADLEPYRVR
jgi:L-alanine-DL-glutamate epimerase-like enolase superfamily enzyme